MQGTEGEEYKKIRNKDTVELRKQGREEIFLKRRNLGDANRQEGLSAKSGKFEIVDQRHRTHIEKCLQEQVNDSQFEEMIKALSDSGIDKVHWGVIGIRRLLSIDRDSTPLIQKMVDKGVLEVLLNMAKQHEYPHVQKESCWIISNLATGTTVHCDWLFERGTLPILNAVLKDGRKWAYEQALWGLGNISGDCPRHRDNVIKSGCIPILINLAQHSQDKGLIKCLAWVLSNLCRGKPLPKYEGIKQIIPVLARMAVSADLSSEQLSDIMWAVCHHSQVQKTKIARIVEVPGFVSRVVQVCHDSINDKALLVPSLRIVGNVSSGNQLHTQQLLKNKALDLLKLMLTHPLKAIRREASWVLSNLAAGTLSQINQLLTRQDIFKQLQQIYLNDHLDVKQQIMYIFVNLGKKLEPARAHQINMQCQVYDSTVNMICQDDDVKSIERGLFGLFSALQVSEKLGSPNQGINYIETIPGFLDRLESLQHHESSDVYKAVIKLFQAFFLLENAQ